MAVRHTAPEPERRDTWTNAWCRAKVALVALGLYVAASLLLQHSVSPRIAGGLPLFAAIGCALALWFTWRITRWDRERRKEHDRSGT